MALKQFDREYVDYSSVANIGKIKFIQFNNYVATCTASATVNDLKEVIQWMTILKASVLDTWGHLQLEEVSYKVLC